MNCPDCGTRIDAATAWHGTDCQTGHQPGYHAPDEHYITAHTCREREWVADAHCGTIAQAPRRPLDWDLSLQGPAIKSSGGYWS